MPRAWRWCSVLTIPLSWSPKIIYYVETSFSSKKTNLKHFCASHENESICKIILILDAFKYSIL